MVRLPSKKKKKKKKKKKSRPIDPFFSGMLPETFLFFFWPDQRLFLVIEVHNHIQVHSYIFVKLREIKITSITFEIEFI